MVEERTRDIVAAWNEGVASPAILPISLTPLGPSRKKAPRIPSNGPRGRPSYQETWLFEQTGMPDESGGLRHPPLSGVVRKYGQVLAVAKEQGLLMANFGARAFRTVSYRRRWSSTDRAPK